MSGSVSLNTLGLQAFKRQLKKAESARVEVGIFSDHADRQGDGPNNVEIGAKHEFGSVSEGIPQRSFLDMPLRTELPDVVRAEHTQLEKSFVEDGPKAMLEQVGFMGEAVVQDAFDTGGFGTWPANSPMTVFLKGSNQPLIDTTQLRKSVSSRVK